MRWFAECAPECANKRSRITRSAYGGHTFRCHLAGICICVRAQWARGGFVMRIPTKVSAAAASAAVVCHWIGSGSAGAGVYGYCMLHGLLAQSGCVAPKTVQMLLHTHTDNNGRRSPLLVLFMIRKIARLRSPQTRYKRHVFAGTDALPNGRLCVCVSPATSTHSHTCARMRVLQTN